VEEEDGSEGDDEYVQEEDWKQEGRHIRKQLPPTLVERGHEMIVQRQTEVAVDTMLLHTDYRIQITESIIVNCSLNNKKILWRNPGLYSKFDRRRSCMCSFSFVLKVEQ
jgi:hypothetical protein